MDAPRTRGDVKRRAAMPGREHASKARAHVTPFSFPVYVRMCVCVCVCVRRAEPNTIHICAPVCGMCGSCVVYSHRHSVFRRYELDTNKVGGSTPHEGQLY